MQNKKTIKFKKILVYIMIASIYVQWFGLFPKQYVKAKNSNHRQQSREEVQRLIGQWREPSPQELNQKNKVVKALQDDIDRYLSEEQKQLHRQYQNQTNQTSNRLVRVIFQTGGPERARLYFPIAPKSGENCWACWLYNLPAPNFVVFTKFAAQKTVPADTSDVELARIIERDTERFLQARNPYKLLGATAQHCERNGKKGICVHTHYDMRPVGGRDWFFNIGRLFLLGMALVKFRIAGKALVKNWHNYVKGSTALLNNATKLKNSIIQSVAQAAKWDPKFLKDNGVQLGAETLGVSGQQSLLVAAGFWVAEGLSHLRTVFYTREDPRSPAVRAQDEKTAKILGQWNINEGDVATDGEIIQYLSQWFRRHVQQQKRDCSCTRYDRYAVFSLQQFIADYAKKPTREATNIFLALNSVAMVASSGRWGHRTDMKRSLRTFEQKLSR